MDASLKNIGDFINQVGVPVAGCVFLALALALLLRWHMKRTEMLDNRLLNHIELQDKWQSESTPKIDRIDKTLAERQPPLCRFVERPA